MIDMWHKMDSGNTVGTIGTENGKIIRDEEHENGARLTLEKDGHHPYAITIGVYGLGVFTTFFSTEEEGNTGFDAIKKEGGWKEKPVNI